ncbi:MAG: phage terminase large subunit [Eubacteriales bacterium]|nr:phage terminase large subunit [Eubacteriales bacterium]
MAELARRELARRNYYSYLLYAHEGTFKRTRMGAFLAGEVQKFIQEETGHAYDILVVNCPPQHGKSMTITESLPSWYLGKYPDKNIIVASYDSDFAERFSKKNRAKIRAFGRRLFGIDIGAVDRASEFELSNGRGRFIARGIMSGITGNPANLIIVDDPVKNRLEADSPTYRQRLWDEWQASVKTRLAAGAKVIIIMTPWREDVFDREVLRTEKNVRHIRLPVEAEEDDPLGRQPGEPLCPEIGKDAAWLAEFKESYIHDPLGGALSWAAMYQCSPRVLEGNLIRREWWRFYTPRDRAAEFLSDGAGAAGPAANAGYADETKRRTKGKDADGNTSDGAEEAADGRTESNVRAESVSRPGRYCPEPAEFDRTVISVDATFKSSDNSDYVAIQVWSRAGLRYYLRYSVNAHLDFPSTCDTIRNIAALFPEAKPVIIEEAANGAAIIATLRTELYVQPVTPKGGKVSRVNAVSFAIQNGYVFVPDPAAEPWVNDYLEQFSTFPNAKHDDMVDSTSQALTYLISGMNGSGEEVRERIDEPTAEEKLFDVYG